MQLLKSVAIFLFLEVILHSKYIKLTTCIRPDLIKASGLHMATSYVILSNLFADYIGHGNGTALIILTTIKFLTYVIATRVNF